MVDGADPQTAAILDIGGGSTEFVVAQSLKPLVLQGESIDMGSVRATEMFIPRGTGTIQELEAMEEKLRDYWTTLSDELQQQLKEKSWIGVAGTVTTLASFALDMKTFDVDQLHGYVFDRCAVSDVYEKLALMSAEQRAAHPMIGSGRADVIVAGAAVLLTAMEFFDRPSLTVSIRGLRYGILLI